MQTVALLICEMACRQGLDSSSRNTLKFIALTYKANLEAFRVGEFQFEILHGAGDDGVGPLENPFSARGYYAFDDANAVYHCVSDEATLIAHGKQTGANVVTSDITSRRMLWDGKSTVLDLISPQLKSKVKSTFHTAEVFEDPDGSRFMSWLEFPIGVGPNGKLLDPMSRDLDNLLNGTTQLVESSVGKTKDGDDFVKFTFQNSSKFKRKYTIDLNKGALPLEVVDINQAGEEIWWTTYEDVAFLDGAGWMPQRVTSRSKPRSDTRITKITSYNVVRKPALTKFSLDFDVPVNITDQKAEIEYGQRTTFSLVDRPRLGGHVQRFVMDRSMPPMSAVPEMPGELPPPSYAIWYAVCAGLAVVLVLIGVGCSRYRKGWADGSGA